MYQESPDQRRGQLVSFFLFNSNIYASDLDVDSRPIEYEMHSNI